MEYYSQQQFQSEETAEKVLNGILTSLAKLTDRNALNVHLQRVVHELTVKNNQVLQTQNVNVEPSHFFVSLAQTKTFLDSFDHFSKEDK